MKNLDEIPKFLTEDDFNEVTEWHFDCPLYK